MAEWTQFNKAAMPVMEALRLLNSLVDESDPDVDVPNIVHAFQTAEKIREAHPKADWFHLTGLIHDLGKMMAFFGEPQWAVVGDTFPVGCAYQDSIVYRDTSFVDNPDLGDNRYNTKLGIYAPNCGLEKVRRRSLPFRSCSYAHLKLIAMTLGHSRDPIDLREGAIQSAKSVCNGGCLLGRLVACAHTLGCRLLRKEENRELEALAEDQYFRDVFAARVANSPQKPHHPDRAVGITLKSRRTFQF